jgi:RimJ/RimL family protein N-acetyltransferase
MTLAQLRTSAAMLLTTKPSDALASYFALEHDEKRTKLSVREDERGRTLAFVAVCQTGIDLFRPLVIARGDDSAALRDVLKAALTPRRQYLFSTPVTLRPDLDAMCDLHGEQVNHVFSLGKAEFQPIVNILVQTSRTPDGQLRAFIKARDGSNAAEAGTSWISSKYAEVYVNVNEGVRGRGLGKSVVSAISNQLLERNKMPIYVTSTNNTASRKLAERLGYRDTGAVELTGAMGLR